MEEIYGCLAAGSMGDVVNLRFEEVAEMSKSINVIEDHTCEVLEKYNARLEKQEIGIQRFSDLRWYWVRWSEKRGNTADGIAYCPYCGLKL